jgi:hypothetical protein
MSYATGFCDRCKRNLKSWSYFWRNATKGAFCSNRCHRLAIEEGKRDRIIEAYNALARMRGGE